MERDYDVVARVTTYVNGNAEKSMVINNPLIYTVHDKLVTVKKEGDINQSALSFCATHNSKAFSKELNVLRSLVNMGILDLSKKPKRGTMYKKNLEVLGLEDFEGYLGKNPEGHPVLFMEISIHGSKEADKRSKTLSSISFRILTEHPDSRTTKSRTDWFRLEPKETEEAPKEDQSVKYPNPPFTPTSVEQVEEDKKKYFESKEFDALASGGTSFGTLAMFANDWIREDYYPKVRDVTVLAYHLNVIGKMMIELDINNPLTNPDTLSDLDRRVLDAYKLLRDFLFVMESKAVVDIDLFRLVARSCQTVGLSQISTDLHARAFKLSNRQS